MTTGGGTYCDVVTVVVVVTEAVGATPSNSLKNAPDTNPAHGAPVSGGCQRQTQDHEETVHAGARGEARNAPSCPLSLRTRHQPFSPFSSTVTLSPAGIVSWFASAPLNANWHTARAATVSAALHAAGARRRTHRVSGRSKMPELD